MIWVVLLGCSGRGESDTEVPFPAARRAMLGALADEVAAARYAELRARADALSAAAAAFCAAPDAAGLAATRQAWWSAREPWKQAEIVMFGPVVDEPPRLGPPLDFWPVRAGVVDDLLAADTPLTVASVGAMGASARGFPVIEHLLWGPGSELEPFPARRCEYVVAASGDLAVNAASLVDAWSAFRPAVVEPESVPGDAWDVPQDAIDEWVNRASFTVENIRKEKLGKPMGDDGDGSPLPDTLESRASGRSLTDARDAFAGMEAALDAGILPLVPEDRAAFVPRLAQARGLAREALFVVAEPLEVAIVEDRSSVAAAQAALRDVQVLLQVELAQALSVTVVFNDNDGD